MVSNLDPKRTFLDITNPKDLPASVVKKAQNFKIRGSSGKLNIALDEIQWPTNQTWRSIFTFSLNQERAYDDWKAGTWSKDPYLDMMIPSHTDPTMAPPGKHMMSVFVQYGPPKVEGREWTDDKNRESYCQYQTKPLGS